MNYIQITINAPRAWEDALTMVLYAHGAPGLEIEDPSIIVAHLARGDWDASVFDGRIIETGRVTLHALFPADISFNSLFEDIAALTPQHKSLFNITSAALPERDWQQVWRESFPTLKVGRTLLIIPYWNQDKVPVHKTAVMIAPGQAFGTGDHATTALALELMEDYLPKGGKVLDVGCGSGILAIAAVKLGAAQALAVDNDPLCDKSVNEHRLLNYLTKEKLNYLPGDILLDSSLQSACRDFAPQLLISNIVAEVIIELAAMAAAFIAKNGLWICSGILHEKEQLVLQAFSIQGWHVLERRERECWLAFCCRHRNYE